MELYLKHNWERIGISISGGADSALLAFLICSNTNADIHFTNQIRLWKTRPWQEHIADNVVDWFKSHFKNNVTMGMKSLIFQFFLIVICLNIGYIYKLNS